ncbi:MAG: adenylate/guanylate cyclase domain-containing protein [Spirochaetales bacterium]|nr:adenylate/guanylate cyclase domain-containing protein [Spirochaetales bacterium]
MKKVPILAIIITAVFLCGTCSQRTPVLSEGPEKVENLGTRTYLAKDWKYSAGDNPDYASPEFDDAAWKSIQFPAVNFYYDLEKSNIYWFRKTFYVSESLKGTPLGYACQKLPEATRLYLNGSLIATSGSMPPEHYFGTGAIPRSYILPDGLINYGGENIIAMKVYTEKQYGDLKLPFITNNADRLDDYFYNYSINVLIPMIIVFLATLVAFYFLLMFLRNREEKFNLYIFLAFVCIAVYSTNFFFEDFPFGYLIATKIWYSGLFLAQMFFAFYFQDFYKIHSNWIPKLIVAVITLGCCTYLCISPTVDVAYFRINRILSIAFIAAINFYILFLSIYAVVKGNKYARVLLAGVSVVIITATHDIIYVNLLMEAPMWLTNTGIVLYILSMFLTSANRFVDTKKEVDKLNIELTQQKDAFFRFVPTQFLSLLGKQSAVDISLGDSLERSMSVLFSDIKEFTSLSEVLSPEENFQLLNSYLLRMESPITDNLGFVDKYVGDAIMALFSESSAEAADERSMSSGDRAVAAAIGMRRQLDEYNKYKAMENEKPLNMGIGINTGPLMLGTVGSQRRLDTTVIGDSVNLASRLERLTRLYFCSIIISEQTYNNLTEPGSILIREIDYVKVKGKNQACKIYEVYEADDDKIKENKLRTKDIILAGIERYRAKRFREALTYFKEAKELYARDYIPLLYIKRCITFIKTPPPPDWDSAFKIHE